MMSTILFNSVEGLFKCLRRAGVLWNRPSTLMDVPLALGAGSALTILPYSITTKVESSPLLVSIVTLLTEAMEGKASPLKPMVEILHKSAALKILLVACLLNALTASSWSMPSPLSITSILSLPPLTTLTIMCVLLASMEFSTSSLTTPIGFSTTSPAAIILVRWSSKVCILLIFFLCLLL